MPANSDMAGKVTVASKRAMPTTTAVPPRRARSRRPAGSSRGARSPRTCSRCRGRRWRRGPARPGRRRRGRSGRWRRTAPRSCASSPPGRRRRSRDAPAMRAPWITDWPTPPHPITVTVAPGLDLRGVQRGADAGGDAAADERELLRREIGLHLHQHRLVDGHLVGEGAEPARRRSPLLPSARVALGAIDVRAHRLAQLRLVAEAEEAVAARGRRRTTITRSPTLTTRLTSLPTASTVPAPSWPRMTGGGSGTLPLAMLRSEWQTPLASMCTRTSCGPIAAAATSSIDQRLVVSR